MKCCGFKKLWLKSKKERKASTSEATAGAWYHHRSAQKDNLIETQIKLLAFHITAQIYQSNLL